MPEPRHPRGRASAECTVALSDTDAVMIVPPTRRGTVTPSISDVRTVARCATALPRYDCQSSPSAGRSAIIAASCNLCRCHSGADLLPVLNAQMVADGRGVSSTRVSYTTVFHRLSRSRTT
ncbi:hypothetical protein C8Q76DRAFT_750627 [Earliella scabrosa]|nr:hypothetical protein C8Q76DRAFT_750627 [Earliella scabrosa]